MLIEPAIKGKNREVANKIGKIFEEGFAKGRRADGFIQKTTFAPSSIGPKYNGSCSRRWVLAFRGQEWEEKTRALNIAIMNAGSDAHERLQNILKDSGLVVEIEKELTLADPPIRGFADAIIEVDGENYVGEFKTTKDAMFEHYAFSGKPNISHQIQVMIYMYITGHKGFVLYQNSNTKEILVLPLDYDQDLIDQVFGWLRKVYTAYQEGQLPERDYRLNGKGGEGYSAVCSSCPVVKACEAAGPKGDIKIGRFEIN